MSGTFRSIRKNVVPQTELKYYGVEENGKLVRVDNPKTDKRFTPTKKRNRKKKKVINRKTKYIPKQDQDNSSEDVVSKPNKLIWILSFIIVIIDIILYL